MSKGKKKTRNKARDVMGDYWKTNRQYSKENRTRQEEQEKPAKGIRNWSSTEKLYLAIIVLGVIAIFIKYVVF